MIQSQSNNSIDSYRERVSKFSTELDLGLVFFIFKKSLWIVALFFLTCLALAFVYLRYSSTVYQSSTIIQINDNAETSKVLQIGNVDNASNKIAEAIEQIRSKVFLNRVISKSDVQISYFNEGTFKNNELYKSSPYFVKLNLKKNNIYGVKIYIKFNNINGGTLTFTLGGRNIAIPFAVNTMISSSYFDFSISLNTELDKVEIENAIKENEKSYFVINNIDAVTNELQSKLDIKLLNEAARTILVTVKDYNAHKSKI